jgi:hypothetical protein
MPYTLSPYPFAKHPSSVSYEVAREYCARFVAGIPGRIEVLADYVKSSPSHRTWRPDLTLISLRELGAWLKSTVKVRPMTEKELREIEPIYPSPMDLRGETLTAETISITIDVAMYLSQAFITMFPGRVKWGKPVKGKRSEVYALPYLQALGPVPLNPIGIVMAQVEGVANQSRVWRWDEVIDFWCRWAEGE